MRISDWSSDVCSSDLVPADADSQTCASGALARAWLPSRRGKVRMPSVLTAIPFVATNRSEEHTSELQSLMRNSYAVFCLKKKIQQNLLQTIKNKNVNNQLK